MAGARDEGKCKRHVASGQLGTAMQALGFDHPIKIIVNCIKGRLNLD